MVNGKQTFHIFSTLDQAEHARMKRPVSKYFSLGHVLALEGHMDTVITDLLKHIDTRFIETKKPCDLGEWIAFCKLSPRHPLLSQPPTAAHPLTPDKQTPGT